MSARTLGQLAAKRDDSAAGTDVSSATAALIATIPTETLAAYTAVVGTVLAADIASQYGPFRWAIFGVFILLAFLAPMLAYRRPEASADGTGASRRTVPLLECAAAALAAAAWGLVMPGSPLTIVVDGNALIFATVSIVVGAAAVLSLATKFLGKANTIVPGAVPPTNPPGVVPPTNPPGAVPPTNPRGPVPPANPPAAVPGLVPAPRNKSKVPSTPK
jgi:hypothetical protein